MATSSISDAIRWPFEAFGSILRFILINLIPISIIFGSIAVIYWCFKSGFIKNLSKRWIKAREEDEKLNIANERR